MSTMPAPDPGPTLRRVDLLPGQVLMHRYEVLRVLGRGAMGEVLEVRDRPSGLSYALKRVPPELVRDKAQMKSIQANFALVSQLAHPHIAITRHLELDPETGHAYLIMEMVHGTDMDLWLADRRAALGPTAQLPMPEILGVAEQIASALDYAHAQPVSRGPDGRPARYGLLHRDLKPANVMVETAREFRPGIPYVKLVDFGLAAEIQASLHENSIQARRENAAGTLLYMAPEQWEGRTLTRGVDQWAFAVVLYDMAAGRKPFAAQSSEALFLQVKRADPEKPATLTPAQWEVFKKAFNPDRRGRYRSCMAFVKALAAADTRTEGSVVSAEMPMPDEFQGVPASGDPPVPATLEDR
ncbi:MAG: serine/threonine protein kinase, partial [Planctomycetota bacterium]|nr:serine/threonine protein kinase [Planctomycetota bacterium]